MGIDFDAIEERIASQAAMLDAATHSLLADIRVWDAENAWARAGARSGADWLSWRVGWTGSTARERIRVARKLGELPTIDGALQRGEISYCKVRAITRVATPANESMLLQLAKLTTGAQLDKVCHKFAMVQRNAGVESEDVDRARRYVRRIEREDGMVKIEAVLHPEEAAAVWTALGEVARRNASAEAVIVRDFDRATALVTMAETVARGDRVNRSPVELVITTTREALEHRESAMEVAVTEDATCIGPAAVRRLACDAGVVEMVVDERGTPLDVGRRLRTVNAQLKRALEHRDPTCKFPGCSNHLFTEAHHIEHWIDGGETKLSNLVRLCGHHHRFVHEYGYSIELDRDLTPSFKTPRGKVVTRFPEPAPFKALDYRVATTGAAWNGTPVDYDWIVGDLYRETERDAPATYGAVLNFG